MKVLIVTDLFPPHSGGRSDKIVKRMRALSEMGVKTFVILPDMPVLKHDAGLEALIPDDAVVERTGYLLRKYFPDLRNIRLAHGRMLNIPGRRLVETIILGGLGFVRWLPAGISAGVKLVREQDIDVVYSVNNPISLHFVAFVIKLRTGVKWVAEFRDSWAAHTERKRGFAAIHRYLERQVVQKSDCVVWHKGMRHDMVYFNETYNEMPSGHFVELSPVGINLNEFDHFADMPTRIKTADEPLVLNYTGSFYADEVTPIVLLKALKAFLQRCPDPSPIRLIFVGDWEDRFQNVVEELGLTEAVECRGHASREKCIEQYGESNVLFLILAHIPCTSTALPPNIWDYIASRRSILALVPPDSKIAEIISSESLGWIVHPSDVEGLANCLSDIYQKYRVNEIKTAPSAAFLDRIDRANSEKDFFCLLRQLVLKDKEIRSS